MTCVTFGVSELLPLLLSHGASTDIKDLSRGRCVFHYCVDEEDVEGLELLVLHDEEQKQEEEEAEGTGAGGGGGGGGGGRAVNVLDIDGASALHFAVRLGNVAAVEVLLRHPHIDVDTVRDDAAPRPCTL
jgi:ankyrin repeat protein